MAAMTRFLAMMLVMAGVGLAVAQTPGDKAPAPLPPPMAPMENPPPADAVAAVVNGQKIPELNVFRSLLQVPVAFRAKKRADVLNFLIDNTLIDQYLGQLKITVENADLDFHVKKIRDEAEKEKQDLAKVLAKLFLTEESLRTELTYALKWEKFVKQQATDKVLTDYFEKNKEMFNGTRVGARHILVNVDGDKKADAQAKITGFKKGIETAAAAEIAKIPANTDAGIKEKISNEALLKAFGDVAAKESTCPSKQKGGDLGAFPRVGAMVEPFAKAAFELKPYQMSEPVFTEFGCHLILAMDRIPGKAVTFEEAKVGVMEVYADKLRDAVIASYKPRSKIEIVEKK